MTDSNKCNQCENKYFGSDEPPCDKCPDQDYKFFKKKKWSDCLKKSFGKPESPNKK